MRARAAWSGSFSWMATSAASASSASPAWSPLCSRAEPMFVSAWASVSRSPIRRASAIARDAQAIAGSDRAASMSSCAWLLYAMASWWPGSPRSSVAIARAAAASASSRRPDHQCNRGQPAQVLAAFSLCPADSHMSRAVCRAASASSTSPVR